MNIDALRKMVQVSEAIYEQIDKKSFKELTEFLGTFTNIYTIFQAREHYKITMEASSPELIKFYNKHDSELELLSKKVLFLADSIDKEFRKFRSPEAPILTEKFYSFFTQSSSTPASSSSVDETLMSAAGNKDKPDEDNFCGFKPGFMKF